MSLTRNTMALVLTVAAAALLACGCIESNPQPSPENSKGDTAEWQQDSGTNPYPPDDKAAYESARMALSAPSADGDVMGVGRAGAAPGAKNGTASVVGNEEGGEVGFTVGDLGQFAFISTAEANQKIKLLFALDDGTTQEVVLTVPERDSGDRMAPWLLDADSGYSDPTPASPAGEDGEWYAGGAGNGPVISVKALGNGMVEVDAQQFATTPLSMVPVMNVNNGESVVVQADALGAFAVQLRGEAGDTVAMFVYNPDDSGKATAPFFVVASGPTP